MKSSRLITIVISLIAVIGGVMYMVSGKAEVPVATVNSHTITREDFNKDYQAIYNYHYAAARTYGDATKFNSKENVDAIKKATLEQLIYSVLIHDEVIERLGPDAEVKVRAKVDLALEKDKAFESAAAAIYGMNFAEVRARFLVPMAESELLREALSSASSTAESARVDLVDLWLETARQHAQVTILDAGFAWSQNMVVAK